MGAADQGASTPDAIEAPSAGLVSALVGFGRALRGEGLAVGPGQMVTYHDGIVALGSCGLDELYWAGRVSLVSRHDDVAVYDRVFRRYFAGGEPTAVTVVGRGHVTQLRGGGLTDLLGPTSEPPRGDETAPSPTMASRAEVLRHKRFDRCTPAELAELAALMSRLRLSVARRRVRRTVAAPRGAVFDVRRTVRRALRSHGDVVVPLWRERRVRPRRLVLILDVSGSMAGYARALLQFSHSASTTVAATEVFCFGTRITRVTNELRQRRPDVALARAATVVVDWDGGTRIGESLGQFVRTWGRRGTARGAVVVICSDGLDRGDPAVLGAEMAKLARLAHRVVWVNPLKADHRYEPLARGMSAALPSVDAFVSGHDLSSLEALAALLPGLG